MIYILFTALLLAFALAALYVAYRLLVCPHWLKYWLRGSSGLLLLGCVVLLCILAFDILSYKTYASQESLAATIRFQKMGRQHYSATFTQGHSSQELTLYGDQWQLNARTIQWSLSDIKAGYRLHRLSGRYLSLNDERNKQKQSYIIYRSYGFLDLWSWIHRYSTVFGVVDAHYTNDIFLPMSDDAYYQVTIDNNELIALPLNPSAKAAVLLWQ